MGAFFDYLTRPEHALVMLAAWVVIGIIRWALPCLDGNRTWLRLLPAMPIILCSVGVWLPGLVEGDTAERILLGLVLGALCGHAYKLVKQTIIGNDKRIRDYPPRL